MMELFNEQYTEVMRRALQAYKVDIEDFESMNGVVHPFAEDLDNVKTLLIIMDQLPDLIKAFQGMK